MLIQNVSNLASVYAAGKPVVAQRPVSGSEVTNTTETVTLSDAAKALVETEKNTIQTRTPAQEKLLISASSDRQSAEKIAEGMANVPSAILWDITDSLRNGGPVTKLASSGRNVDDKFVSQFDSEASVIDAQRRALYESEKAKGTDPLQILAKMIDFTNSQTSNAYREATGQGYQG